MSSGQYASAWDCERVNTAAEKLLLLALADNANEETAAPLHLEHLAAMACMSPEEAMRTIRAFEGRGLLRFEPIPDVLVGSDYDDGKMLFYVLDL